MLRSSELPVLRAALRTRIVDAAGLAAILGMPEDAVRASLERLAADGLIVRSASGDPALRPPQRAVVEAALAEVRVQLAALDGVREALETMPARSWTGAPAAERAEVRMELLHGTDAVVDAWWRLDGRDHPVDLFACVPDRAAFARIATEAARERSAEGSRIRVIVGRTPAPHDADAVAAVRGRGAEIRTLDRAPGWFAGEGEGLSAFPTSWGVPWPLSVRILRDPLASQSLRSFFDELWRRALPLEEEPAGWEPVLRLLEGGLDDADVAETLGVSERTVRRRVEEAMLDLGVTTRFALGRAWAARR